LDILIARFGETLEAHPSWVKWQANPGDFKGGEALSLAMFDLLHDLTTVGSGFLLNSSTGKDSTLMVALFCRAMEVRAQEGRLVRPAIIGISDTGSEFPAMAERMETERVQILRYAARRSLPIDVQIVRPKAKSRLLPEILGNGLALPQLKSGKSASGWAGASWCMDRVKASPLQAVLEIAQSRFSTVLQCLGVRSEESVRRATNINNHGAGLPFGLTRLAGDGAKSSRLGITPIVHWSNDALRLWLHQEGAPWDLYGGEKLREVYALGAPADDPTGSADPKECPVAITKEGAVTNTCSDLGGVRFGCWMCLLSTNKSLKNAASKDQRYEWMRDFHQYLYGHHARGDARRELRNAAGFTDETFFPKGFTMLERMHMLRMLFRAELESGFELLTADDLTAIRRGWRRHGQWTLEPADIREDAVRWKETGEMTFSFDQDQQLLRQTSIMLGEGIPLGAHFHVLEEDERPLELAHLVAAAGWGSPIFPVLSTYVMLDRARKGRYLLMVTDTPSALGGRTNTGLLNGLCAANWEVLGVREPTAWEEKASDGRTVMFELPRNRWQGIIDGQYPQLLPTVLESNQVISFGCAEECALSEQWRWASSAQGAGLDPAQFKALYQLVDHLALASDDLGETAITQRGLVDGYLKGREAWLSAREPEGQTPEADKFRKKFRAWAREELMIAETRSQVEEYVGLLRRLAVEIRSGRAPTGLVNRMAYLSRMARIDPDEAQIGLTDLIRIQDKRWSR
jgi:3'-phosphoadenosine 5'-phosphosulfate sulfotransferase (PAPS reductase)/FAD synthetase